MTENRILKELDELYGNGGKARALMLVQTAIIITVPIIAIYSITQVDSLIILLAIFGMMLINWINSVLSGMRESVTMDRLEAHGLKVMIVEQDKK